MTACDVKLVFIVGLLIRWCKWWQFGHVSQIKMKAKQSESVSKNDSIFLLYKWWNIFMDFDWLRDVLESMRTDYLSAQFSMSIIKNECKVHTQRVFTSMQRNSCMWKRAIPFWEYWALSPASVYSLLCRLRLNVYCYVHWSPQTLYYTQCLNVITS